MPTSTTMLIKLKDDQKLAEMLRSFLKNELAINLETLHESPIELWPPQHLPKANIYNLAPTEDDLVHHDPRSLLRLRTLGDYFESDESNAVLPLVCKDNTIFGVLNGGAGVSIVTNHY